MAEYKIRGTKVVTPYPAQLTPGEVRLIFGLEKIFLADRIFADCYFPKVDPKLGVRRVVTKADLVQIDCMVVDESGVYVFESKDYIGWIYAHGKRVHWTQVSGYGKNKHQFYSPVRQNESHIAAVRTVIGKEVPIYSVVVFGREATLKVVEDLPEECIVCTQAEVRNIMSRMSQEKCLDTAQVEELCQAVRRGLVNPDGVVRTEHIEEVQEIAGEGGN